MNNKDIIELFGLIIAWLVSLIVVVWRISKIINGVGLRVEVIEVWKIKTDTHVEDAKLELIRAQLERTQLAKDVAAATIKAEAAIVAAALSSDKIMEGIDQVKQRLTKVETVIEERIPRHVA